MHSDQSQLAFFKESGAYATASGGAKWIGMVQSHEPEENTGVIQARYLGTATRNVDQHIDGPKTFTGTISYFPQDWQFLYYTLGKVTDGGSPSPYTHTVTEADGNNVDPTNGEVLPSFQIEDHQGIAIAGSNLTRTYKGCNINEMTINIPQGEPVTCDVAYVAQDITVGSGAKSSVSADTNRPYLWSDVNIHIPSGTTYGNISNMTITMNNNLLTNQFVDGNRTIGTPAPGPRDYTIEITKVAQAGANMLTDFNPRS
jgi:sporulation protein YlmC with PRC-barrel domain